ncbi:helix-turn-helix domain-containing protein [Micromonospora sp. NPDC000089]|uniref:helix-turn-helix domain-containing protein n=1 Tax=unclassified Micromonospora TaxID=2617518 RepID=UPI0036CFB15D
MGELGVVTGRPEARLLPYVDRYVGYRERVEPPGVRRETAGAFVVLILGWGAPLDVIDPRCAQRGATGTDSFVAGTFDGYCTTRTAGVGTGAQVVLTPPAARRILGLPLVEVANRAVAVEQLPDRWLDRLRCRLAEAPHWAARFRLLDAALLGRLAATEPVDPRLGRAWRRLSAGDGQVGVGELAAELGWSRRHLATVFRREFGLTPKTTGRLLRFARAHAALTAAGGVAPHGAELAARCGYYDQSHLIRDFREFAGETPAALLRSHSSNPG